MPDGVNKRRNNELLAIQDESSSAVHREYVGLKVRVFVESVAGYGERSLIAIDGALTHAVRRVSPLVGEPGEEATRVEPTTEECAFAEHVLVQVGAPVLYARIDLVRGDGGELYLMELELVEPSLFLRFAPEAVERFADAIAARAA